MFDSQLRPIKDAALRPLAQGPLRGLPPIAITGLGLAASLAAAFAAWDGLVVASVAFWLLGRVFDGLDGAVARLQGRQRDLGGVVDVLVDTIGYAVVPLGLAAGRADDGLWIATAVLLASFYINAVSIGQTAAVLEKRALGAGMSGEPTSTTLPRGIIEGAETIAFFTVALAIPQWATAIWALMAVAVAVTAAERAWWLSRRLATSDVAPNPRPAPSSADKQVAQ